MRDDIRPAPATPTEIQLDATRRHIQAAIETMGRLVIEETPSSATYHPRTIDFYQEIFTDLLKLRARLS